MLCPEGDIAIQNEADTKEAGEICPMKMSSEGSPGNTEFTSALKNPKSWKKSFTSFFRHQIRTTRSSDGDGPSINKEQYSNKEISSEQKWQSLGKVFRRQSFIEPWNKAASNHHGESSTSNKRIAVRKVLSSYFGKTQKSSSESDNK